MTFATLFLAPDGRLRPLWRAWLFFPAWIAGAIVLTIAFFPLFGESRIAGNRELGLLLQSLILLPSAVLASWALVYVADKRSFRTVGLWFYDGWRKELALGLAVGAGMNSVIVGALLVGGQVQLRVGRLDPLGALAAAGWAMLLLVPAAMMEEMVFRGYPFQRLVDSAGSVGAILVLSVFFGLVHRDNPAATWLSTANTVLAGVWLAVCYLKTRALWLPIGAHFAWNFVMGFVYSLPVSGIVLRRQMLIADIGGPEWLTGGNYGPEGSIWTTVVLAAATLWLARTKRLEVSPGMAAALQ
jgi:hypothetical protein